MGMKGESDGVQTASQCGPGDSDPQEQPIDLLPSLPAGAVADRERGFYSWEISAL
jgi:hypothetical protein